ncbi:dynamin family protein [Fusobacterium varium]|uniref:dynamin family protein n=1 Tax=Fusobacterium varium TaxID=856 RepID=UPI0035614C97
MKEIFIKYNPYKVETEIRIDGNAVKKNSELNVQDMRFQEWIERLPEILVNECNSKNFKIIFHGTILDYEDLISIIERANQGEINIQSEHIPAKEIKDKEKLINDIFKEIQNGPFEELKQDDVKKAFEIANNSEFPVNVVATMSAGKSTLINALLGEKLMPSKQEACTATITEIQDNDLDYFSAEAYDKSENLIEHHSNLNLEIMDKLNRDSLVSKIKVTGDIPFVSAEDISLVLVDTPGPNNSRDPEHKVATYRMLSKSSKTVVLYVLNATQLAVDDDNTLLSYVAESMKVGGKQSKDRFLFVLNKVDEFRKEDNLESTIKKVKEYLENKGIYNPNILPVSALTALNIRTILKSIENITGEYDDDDIDETITKIRKFNRNDELHLENYANLTPSIRGEINASLIEAQNNEDKKMEALIHTGITAIESSIRMYVTKYAKTAKIKNIVDTFSKKLESVGSFENTKKEIAENEEQQEKVREQIERIKEKVNSKTEAEEFKKKLKSIEYTSEINKGVGEVREKIETFIADILEGKEDRRIKKTEAEGLLKELNKKMSDFQGKIQVNLEETIQMFLEETVKKLLEDYKKRIIALSDELGTEGEVSIEPFDFIEGNIKDVGTILSECNIEKENIVIGTEWVENENKKWYKPWTWFSESGYYRDIYAEEEIIQYRELSHRFLAPMQQNFDMNIKNAKKYASAQIENIKKYFDNQFDEIDAIIGKKLEELEACISNENEIQKTIEETTKKLNWLKNIQIKIESILEI